LVFVAPIIQHKLSQRAHSVGINYGRARRITLEKLARPNMTYA
jgi:hypothetical protein